jgi:hypothetical protein
MWNWINKQLDRLESRLALFVYLSGQIAVTGLGAYVAAVTNWLSVWGPVGYLVVGISCAIAFSFCLYLFGLFLEARSRRMVNLKRAEESTRVNILDDSFEGEVIFAKDIWSFQHQKVSGKRFHRCRFVGPMVIGFLNNVTANGLSVNSCNFIEIGDSYLNGVIGFENCILTDCEYDCVTFLVHGSMAEALTQASNGSIKFVARPNSGNPAA